MSDPGVSLRTAIHALLTSAVSIPVYDYVPQDASFPYVSIGADQALMADYLNSRKERRDIYISVFSNYRGQKEVLEIMAQIGEALHNKRPALSVGRIARMDVREKEVSPESDGVTYMGRVRVQALVEH